MDSDIKQLRSSPIPASQSPGLAKGAERASGNNAQQSGGQAVSTATGSDTVTVTDQAARLQELEQSLASTPVVDSARVAELREAIASGSYQPDAQRIADRLSQLEQDLL